MQMTDTEILGKYNRSDDKKGMVQILADLNSCDKDTIQQILIQGGVPESEFAPKKRRKRQPPALPCNDDSGSKDESDAPAEDKPESSTENAPDSPETDENGTDNISSADEDNDAEIDATEALFGTDGEGKEDSDEPSDDYGYDDPEEE